MIFSGRILSYAAILITVGLIAGLTISSTLSFHQESYADDVKISREALDVLSKTNQALAEVVAAVKPSVVNISSVKTVKTAERQAPFFQDPFFKRFFGDEGHTP